jgi:hypothetical protein
MVKESTKTLTDRIEETIEGILRFVIRFFRTVIVILFIPWASDRILLRADQSKKEYVRPLTFLAIGGFVFSVTISVYPKGFLGLIDIVWYNEQINETILQRWQEALSVTGLVIAAFPILLTVTTGAALAGLAFQSSWRREEFFSLNCYFFGYQYFLLFSYFFSVILSGILHELMGVEVKEVLGLDNVTVSPLVLHGVAACLIVVFLSALVMPTVGLCHWTARVLRRRSIGCKAAACGAVALYCLLMLIVCAYTASTPAAFKQLAAPKLAEIKIDFLENPVVRLSADHGKSIATMDLNIAIENVPDAHLIAAKSDITVGIVAEFDNKPDQLWPSNDFKMYSEGRELSAIILEKGRIGQYRLIGTVSLPDETVKLIQQKINKPTETNEYRYFTNIRLRRGSEKTDRRLFLDVDKIVEQTKQ